MKNLHLGSDFDDFLSEHDLLADAEAVAIQRLLASQEGNSSIKARDDWERRLLSTAKDCGVSLPDSAVSSDELYV